MIWKGCTTAPTSLSHHPNPVLHRRHRVFAPVQQALGALGPKDLLHPILSVDMPADSRCEKQISAVKHRGREPPDIRYCRKILLLRRVKMVLCPFHGSHREIRTRNRPVSETKFLDDFWWPLSLPAPLVYC